MTAPVPRAVRLWLSAALALLAGAFSWQIAHASGTRGDFAQVWYAAGAVLRGANPYLEIGPGRVFDWFPWYYPLPAAFVALPVAPLTEHAATAVFVMVGVGAFAWALMEHGLAPLLAFFTVSMFACIGSGQWAPIMGGAYAIAPLSVVLVAKPTIGAAVFAARPNWWAVVGGLALLAIAFVVSPGWVTDWRYALSGAGELSGHKFPSPMPVMLRGGALVLLALTRWRRPEARLLVALACVPQTVTAADTLLLFLVPRGIVQCAALALSNNLMGWWIYHSVPPTDLVAREAYFGGGLVLAMYLPATAMVLLRPNDHA